MQIEGGTAAVRVFRFEDHDNMIQCQSECSFSNCGVDILVARNVVETIQFGCHVAGPFRTLLHKDFFSQKKTISCFRGHSLRDWLP